MSKHRWVGSWRPHRPRVPVASQFRSPGPQYGLPSGIGYEHCDPSTQRAPAFSFGLRLGDPELPRSPGPQYMVPTGCTARGRDRGPAFTMSGRARQRRASDTPGPGEPRREGGAGQKPPELWGRVPSPPGPGSYQLPPVMGPHLVNKKSAPQCTMTGRGPSIFENKKTTPGPSKYSTVDTNVYMTRAPRCTMTGRSRPRAVSHTPGPSDYSPNQKQGQTFGVRHSESVIPVMDSRP
uniref:Outer dense fiber protein 3-like protein 2 n=1 Tax=Catharus ustulatus TaxID=91951 RepID=A0A8C3Y9S8_CATUS